MDLLQGIDTLLKFNVVWWKLGLWGYWIQSKLAWSVPVRMDCHRTLSSALPSCSLTYCWVRAAKGEMEDLLSRSVRQIDSFTGCSSSGRPTLCSSRKPESCPS